MIHHPNITSPSPLNSQRVVSLTRRSCNFAVLCMIVNVIPIVISFHHQIPKTYAFMVVHPVVAIQHTTETKKPRLSSSSSSPPQRHNRRLWGNNLSIHDASTEEESTLMAGIRNMNDFDSSLSTTTTSTALDATNAIDTRNIVAPTKLKLSHNKLPTTWIPIYNWNRSIALLPTMVLALSILLLYTSSIDTAYAATTTTTTAAAATLPIEWNVIFQKAFNRAVGGGQAGALAAVVQVCTLMWLRTCMNYQYRYGGNLITSFQTLYNEGGIPRLYQGLPFAILQGPLTRFGDTAANVGILSLLESIPMTQSLPLPIKTLCGSLTAGLWRILLMPIDTSKTSMQVEGSRGLQKLYSATMEYGPGVLYRGSLAQAAATAVGHFPWFLTYNFFNDIIPIVDTTSGLHDPNTLMLLSLGRSALLGLLASCVSDCSSNSLRVIKTTKQTAQLNDSTNVDTAAPTTTFSDTNKSKNKELSYLEVIQLIIDQDGIKGLFGRGLQTRLLTNAIQGAMFSVLWKYFQQ